MTVEAMEAVYRSRYGLSRTDLNRAFLADMPLSTRILEVGANVGNQLLCLRKMGFTRLVGVDVHRLALERLKVRDPTIAPVIAVGQAVPFLPSTFDLVFTSGLLIHIPPEGVVQVLREIHRCSSRYIWGFEYYADKHTEVEYRWETAMMWKTDFAKLYMETFPDLEVVQRKRLGYREEPLEDEMFLLRKRTLGPGVASKRIAHRD